MKADILQDWRSNAGNWKSRSALVLYRAAQAMAYLDGRSFCTPEDFKTLAVPVFGHRVVVSARYSSILVLRLPTFVTRITCSWDCN